MPNQISIILHQLQESCLRIPILDRLAALGFIPFTATLAGTLAFLILLVTLLIAHGSRRSAEKRCKKKLCTFFSISDLSQYRVERMGGPGDKYYSLENHNTLRLNLPYWKYAEEDGSRSRTRKRNKIIRPESILWLRAGKYVYVIRTQDPLDMLLLVHKLRDSGLTIPPCAQEIVKQEELSNMKKNDEDILKGIIDALDGDETKFARLCKDRLTERGYIVSEMPKNSIGADLFLNQKEKVYVVKCLLTPRDTVTGMEALRQFRKMVAESFANYCMLITTGRITFAAAQYAEDNGIAVINNENLVKLLDKNPSAEPGKEFLNWELTAEDVSNLLPSDIPIVGK